MLDSKSLVSSIKSELFDQLSNSINERFNLGEDSFFQRWREDALESLEKAGAMPLTLPDNVSASDLLSQGFSIAQVLKLGGIEGNKKPAPSKPVKEEVAKPGEAIIPRKEIVEKVCISQAQNTARSPDRRPRYDDGTLVAGARSSINSEQEEADFINEQILRGGV